MSRGTAPRDASGHAQSFVDPAASPALAGRWFAYCADAAGWRLIGIFNTEAEARAAAGLPEKGEYP